MPQFGFSTTGKEVVETYPEKVQGKTFIITGPSIGGIGAQTALSLTTGKPKAIFLLGPTSSKITPVIQEIISISPTTKAIFIPLDLSSFSSIRAAAATITSTISTFDVLINNAGIMGVPTYLTTEAGIESQFAQNHIGHFLLTNLLLPKLSPNNGRIINIASIGYKFGPVRFEDYNFDNGEKYHPWHAYGQSKTANMLFSAALAKRGINSFSVQPGNVNQTNLMRYLPGEGGPQQEKFMANFMEEIAKTGFVFPEPKSLEQGCATSIVAAISTEIEGNKGGFLNDCVVGEGVVEYARSEENAERLWRLSEELVGEKFEF